MKKILPLRMQIKDVRALNRKLSVDMKDLHAKIEKLERRNEITGRNLADATFTHLLETTRAVETKMATFKSSLVRLLAKLSMLDDAKLMRTYMRNTEVAVRKDDWEVIRRMTHNLRVIGTCSHCAISVYGRKGHAMPEPSSMPCGISQCPYDEDHSNITLSSFMSKFNE